MVGDLASAFLLLRHRVVRAAVSSFQTKGASSVGGALVFLSPRVWLSLFGLDGLRFSVPAMPLKILKRLLDFDPV
jgi:hypothetical protein